MPDEEAFSLLVRLMSVYDLQGHFLPEMPKLQLRLVSEIHSLFRCFLLTVPVPSMVQQLEPKFSHSSLT